MEPYLFRLADRLSSGLARMDEPRRQRHREFILGFQEADGGFRGREGDSDLYYTSFAVRGLVMLGGLDFPGRGRLQEYIRSQKQQRLNVIDLVSWLYTLLAIQASTGEDLLGDVPADWSIQIAAALESTRTADGGYAKSTEGAMGSTYHSFLVGLTYELIGQPIPRPNALIQFLYDRQREDGGFVEIEPMKRSGTNPTAAAVALLQMLGGMDSEIREDVEHFLKQVRSSEGGFQANTRIPFADGLSTFTGLLTMQDLDIRGLLESKAIEKFVSECLEFPIGGFRGASWDEQADVEYTFYGLGNLALLWSAG